MESNVFKTQEEFNTWTADWDEVLTYQDVVTEAYSNNLSADKAIEFAAERNL